MTSPLTKAVLKSGIIPPGRLEEFRRWGAPIELPEEPAQPKSLEEASAAIEEALQSEGYMITRETDLDALKQYLSTQTSGVLHVEIFSQDPTLESAADIDVSYGTSLTGCDFIIPWKSESIAAELTNGACYLTGPKLDKPVYFESVKELFFGEHKAFMLCTARVNPEDFVRDTPAPQLEGGDDAVQPS